LCFIKLESCLSVFPSPAVTTLLCMSCQPDSGSWVREQNKAVAEEVAGLNSNPAAAGSRAPVAMVSWAEIIWGREVLLPAAGKARCLQGVHCRGCGLLDPGLSIQNTLPLGIWDCRSQTAWRLSRA
jgi:hypothetical protein